MLRSIETTGSQRGPCLLYSPVYPDLLDSIGPWPQRPPVNGDAMSKPVPAGAIEVQAEASAAQRPLRFISAASLFDVHEAAINMKSRLLQKHGAEVIHHSNKRS